MSWMQLWWQNKQLCHVLESLGHYMFYRFWFTKLLCELKARRNECPPNRGIIEALKLIYRGIDRFDHASGGEWRRNTCFHDIRVNVFNCTSFIKSTSFLNKHWTIDTKMVLTHFTFTHFTATLMMFVTHTKHLCRALFSCSVFIFHLQSSSNA